MHSFACHFQLQFLVHKSTIVNRITVRDFQSWFNLWQDASALLSFAKNAGSREQNPWSRLVCDRRHSKRRNRGGKRRSHYFARAIAGANHAAPWTSIEIQIDDDLFIVPVSDGEREGSMLCSNHSCDAIIGMRGEITFVAMCDIRAGEELTHDWATTDDDDYSVECRCGSSNCRKILIGKDGQRPDLQKRYAGYFSAYLARKIAQR